RQLPKGRDPVEHPAVEEDRHLADARRPARVAVGTPVKVLAADELGLDLCLLPVVEDPPAILGSFVLQHNMIAHGLLRPARCWLRSAKSNSSASASRAEMRAMWPCRRAKRAALHGRACKGGARESPKSMRSAAAAIARTSGCTAPPRPVDSRASGHSTD